MGLESGERAHYFGRGARMEEVGEWVVRAGLFQPERMRRGGARLLERAWARSWMLVMNGSWEAGVHTGPSLADTICCGAPMPP